MSLIPLPAVDSACQVRRLKRVYKKANRSNCAVSRSTRGWKKALFPEERKLVAKAYRYLRTLSKRRAREAWKAAMSR